MASPFQPHGSSMSSSRNHSQRNPFDEIKQNVGFSKSSSTSFPHKISIRLDEKTCNNEGTIIANKFHRLVVNPVVPLQFGSDADRDLGIESKDYQQWLVQDQVVFTWLLSTIYETMLPRVLGCKHAFQVWNKLHDYFSSHLKARVRQLKSELKNSKKGTKSMSDYLLKIKLICDALLAAGVAVSEQDHIDTVLDGLPEDYNTFVMMIYGRNDSPSLNDVEALLLVQEAQLDKYKQELNTSTREC